MMLKIILSSLLLLGFLPHILCADLNYRLNVPIVPSSYNITITPYFNTDNDRRFTFDGTVTITFKTTEKIKQIKLHAEDLNITAADVEIVTADRTKVIPLDSNNPLEFNKTYDFVFINLQEELEANGQYDATIRYIGSIRGDLKGFYRNYYQENGSEKWLGATQMEPTNARKVFPCFDEPGLKAVFQLSIDRPTDFQPTLSNTEIQLTTNATITGYVREVFYQTPIMPTYLVAFLVSEFEPALMQRNGTREFGVYTRPDAKNQSSFAFEFGQKVEEALSVYFGIDYYSSNEHLRLDHVALPDFRAGAMENWGLIKYREYLLLYVPEVTSPVSKYTIAQIIAHETTHMWFGNLVTCHWWSDIWLNEGFASYFQDYITSLVEPELGSANMLVIGSVYNAYNVDESTGTPISNAEVDSPDNISAHFGQISYSKAGSVIRMMHHLVQEDAFKYGLSSYLKNNSFGSGYPEALYASLQDGVNAFNSMGSYPGFIVSDIMRSWITQAGHPVVQVDIDFNTDTVVLTQKRFYMNSSRSSDELYKIPITYTTAMAPDFDNTNPAFVMENKTHEIKIANISQAHSWVIFNVQETGLYRVNYDEHSWGLISSELKKDHKIIHHLNRAKIINDLFALFHADEVAFSVLYDVLDYLPAELEYSVWFAALKGFEKLRDEYLYDAETSSYIENYILKYLNMAVASVRFETRDTDTLEDIKNRVQILKLACKLNQEECVEQSILLFKGLRYNGTEVPPSLRSVVYCNGLRYGNEEDYNFMWNRLNTTNVATEASIIIDSLACTSDENSLKTYLISRSLPGTSIRYQDNTLPLTNVLSNNSHIPIVMESLNTNYSVWVSIYTDMIEPVELVAQYLRTENDFNEMEAWLSSCTECTEPVKERARLVINKVKQDRTDAEKRKPDILKSLKNGSSVISPSIFLVIWFSLVLTCN